jgi:hypothetical protein
VALDRTSSKLHSDNASSYGASNWHSCTLLRIFDRCADHGTPAVRRVFASYQWLRRHCRFLLLFMLDGHNGTVHIFLSASCSGGGSISTSTSVVHTDGHTDTAVGYVATLISWLVECIVVANGHLDSVGYCSIQCRVPLL